MSDLLKSPKSLTNNKNSQKSNGKTKKQANRSRGNNVTMAQLLKMIQQTNSRVANLFNTYHNDNSSNHKPKTYRQKVVDMQSTKKFQPQKNSINTQSARIPKQNSKGGKTVFKTDNTSTGGKQQSQLLLMTQIHPIHPSNFFLFPTLDGIWQHYQKFYFEKFYFQSNPTCSLMQGGNFLISTVTPQQLPNLSIPSFDDLINFATTTLWPVAKNFVGPIASSVLQRAANYLMNNANTSLSTPGSILISNNLAAVQSEASNPLITFTSQLVMDQFKPVKQPSVQQDKIVYVTGSYTAGASLDYHIVDTIYQVPGYNVSLTQYPSTATTPLATSHQGWNTFMGDSCAILISGYRGLIRVTVMSTRQQLQLPKLQWIPVNKSLPSKDNVQFRVKDGLTGVYSFYFDVTQDGVLFWPGYGAMTCPFTTGIKLWPVNTIAIQFQAKTQITQTFRNAKHFKSNNYLPSSYAKNRVLSKKQSKAQLLRDVQTNPGPQQVVSDQDQPPLLIEDIKMLV